MALKQLSSDQIIYEKGSAVDELALVIKGSVSIIMGHESFQADAGSVIGLCEPVGQNHRLTYITKGDTTIYTYDYNDKYDIVSLLEDNEKLAPTITLSIIKNANSLYIMTKQMHKLACTEYDKLLSDLKRYPTLCAKTGKESKDFTHLEKIQHPDFESEIAKWKINYISTLASRYNLMSPIYSIGSSVCTGFAINSVDFSLEVCDELEKISSSFEEFKRETLAFRTEISTLDNAAGAIESGEGEITMPSMDNSLSQILMYAEYPEDGVDDITRTIDSYVKTKNRTEVNDSLRALRRRISGHFYEIYKSAFLKAINDTDIPSVVKMFLYFGFLDERLVTEDDLKDLYGFSVAYRYDGGKIITMYEWLKKIFYKEVNPSLNEFQQDYPTYLKEMRNNGDINDSDMERLLSDSHSRLDYEIKNLFTMGNRMTFGRFSIFVPVFDSQCKMLPLQNSHLSNDVLITELDRIRSLDYSIFYREKLFFLPGNDGIQTYVHEEQIPYMIIFPIVGQNMVLWQTIEGRVRNSPSRMLLPAFFDDNVTDAFTTLCGDYRWEICKTDQGVRWTDITDPSLTAEYHDFLQFYKKNRGLSKDAKEKVNSTLKKYSNNYKKVFINDYKLYIKHESAGNLRLMKQQREIIFKYCPFSRDTRNSLLSNPQYEKLIEIRNNKTEQKTRPIQNVIQKIKNLGNEPPIELVSEITYLEN